MSSEDEMEEAYIDVLMECPFCGAYVPDDYECLMCRAKIFEDYENQSYKYICSICGAEVEETDERCTECGVSFI